MITVLYDRAIARAVMAMRRDASLLVEPPIAKRARRPRSPEVPIPPTRSLPLVDRPPRRTFAEAMRFMLRASPKALLRAFVLFHLWYIGVTTILVACFAFVDPAATTLSVYRKYVDGWTIVQPVPTRLERIPKLAQRMLVSIEDYKFYDHHGVDFEAFARAYEVNQKIGRPMYGGSTLTMQTARTLFLVPFKSYVRKYLEVIVALELEAMLPKERILELYFSWAEWGKGVFGIEAASKKYFQTSVARLGSSQTARLMAVLSSPIRYTPSTLAKSALLAWRYDFLLKRYVR
jgi:monofunctional biosynthetic peptidoglycan transglycosylase